METNHEPISLIADANGGVAEAYRSLRVSLGKQMALGKKAFALVSAWPGDGKSMVCTNLAIAMSQLHQKMLLIDGDLRRPTISRVFGAHQMRGLSDDLEKMPENFCLGYASKYPNTYVLPRGLSEINPSNLLSHERLQRLFQVLRDTYDGIIVDTPPLSACSDALILAGIADAAILVVSPKGWDGEVEVRYKQQLNEHGIEVVGAVLNGAHGAESHGYGYGYGHGYGYGYGYGKAYGNYGNKSGSERSPGAKRRAWGGFKWPWSRPDETD